ncbi:MAG: hypothetical protein AAFN77_18760 [Planctomycetota bacterium]
MNLNITQCSFLTQFWCLILLGSLGCENTPPRSTTDGQTGSPTSSNIEFASVDFPCKVTHDIKGPKSHSNLAVSKTIGTFRLYVEALLPGIKDSEDFQTIYGGESGLTLQGFAKDDLSEKDELQGYDGARLATKQSSNSARAIELRRVIFVKNWLILCSWTGQEEFRDQGEAFLESLSLFGEVPDHKIGFLNNLEERKALFQIAFKAKNEARNHMEWLQVKRSKICLEHNIAAFQLEYLLEEGVANAWAADAEPTQTD